MFPVYIIYLYATESIKYWLRIINCTDCGHKVLALLSTVAEVLCHRHNVENTDSLRYQTC